MGEGDEPIGGADEEYESMFAWFAGLLLRIVAVLGEAVLVVAVGVVAVFGVKGTCSKRGFVFYAGSRMNSPVAVVRSVRSGGTCSKKGFMCSPHHKCRLSRVPPSPIAHRPPTVLVLYTIASTCTPQQSPGRPLKTV